MKQITNPDDMKQIYLEYLSNNQSYSSVISSINQMNQGATDYLYQESSNLVDMIKAFFMRISIVISISILLVYFYVQKSIEQTLETDAEVLTKIAGYIIRSSFWAVLILGIVDFIISYLSNISRLNKLL